ncbi:hypothetical protein CGCVW01_v012806 [Colletotrichum viniferum]|nr:hypothetical protein CGCVW01_v012806 [Colletotrichum viniferum]
MPTHSAKHPLCIIFILGKSSSPKAIVQTVTSYHRRAGEVGLVRVTPRQPLLSIIITAELLLQFIGLASTSVLFPYRKRKLSKVPSITHPRLLKGLPRKQKWLWPPNHSSHNQFEPRKDHLGAREAGAACFSELGNDTKENRQASGGHQKGTIARSCKIK